MTAPKFTVIFGSGFAFVTSEADPMRGETEPHTTCELPRNVCSCGLIGVRDPEATPLVHDETCARVWRGERDA